MEVTKSNNSIPVIGALVLTEPQWIKKQIESIDFPVDNYIVINNNPTGDINDELESIINTSSPYIKNSKVWHMPCNLGVAGGWNLIIKSFINSPYWVIANHDVSFGPGLLKEMFQASKYSEVGVIHPNAGDFEAGSFDLFLLKSQVVQKIGLFDENFSPAYGEDVDYIFRMRNAGVKRILGLSNKYFHGETYDYYLSGMNTKKSLPNVSFEDIHHINFEYLYKKWGEGWRTQSIWETPFNLPNLSLKTTLFDLDFYKRKHFEI